MDEDADSDVDDKAGSRRTKYANEFMSLLRCAASVLNCVSDSSRSNAHRNRSTTDGKALHRRKTGCLWSQCRLNRACVSATQCERGRAGQSRGVCIRRRRSFPASRRLCIDPLSHFSRVVVARSRCSFGWLFSGAAERCEIEKH